jgi:putative ATP-dependent endonuclease of the OLD family
MYVSRLVIRNFRNFRHLDLVLQRGVTCIIGENNTGKTNLLHGLRLAIDANLSNYRRRLLPEDFASGLSYRTPQQVLVAVEFSDFTGNAIQEAMVFDARADASRARITYRFRPRRPVREAILAEQRPASDLSLEDYRWELRGGGVEDPTSLDWSDDSGQSVRIEDLFQTFAVVTLDALRDAEQIIGGSPRSPLRRLLTPEDVPEEEQEALVALLGDANDEIASSATIQRVGSDLGRSLEETAGEAFTMGVKLGMTPPTFADISRSLSVLLSNNALESFGPQLNGLGMNNVLYASMLLQYFQRRVDEQKTAGQLLLFEEPEAHIHPQLERVLFRTLKERGFQVLVTTHSTHTSSQADLASMVVLTNDGTPATATTSPGAALTAEDVGDIERYLDATRGVLLYARKVMLVEGPAELFLIPPLVREVLGVDLDAYGISVVPIYGVHFEPYARLFGPDGLPKRCAIVADGDLQPSDARPEGERDASAPRPAERLGALENEYVGVFLCETTFERALTGNGTLGMLSQTCEDLGALQVARSLRETMEAIEGEPPDETGLLAAAGERVLRTAKRHGKARFAQVAARHVRLAASLPEYIQDAVLWLLS